jgi:hypothetical protein
MREEKKKKIIRKQTRFLHFFSRFNVLATSMAGAWSKILFSPLILCVRVPVGSRDTY